MIKNGTTLKLFKGGDAKQRGKEDSPQIIYLREKVKGTSHKKGMKKWVVLLVKRHIQAM